MMIHGKYIMISVICTATLLAAGCSSETAEEQPVSRTTNVEVYTVEPMPFDEFIHLPVTVRPNREVELGAPNGGEVTALYADKGDEVRKGDVLLETDTTLAEAQLMTAEANLEYQENEFQRNQRLLEEGSITQAAFDQVKLQYSLAQSNFDQAKKQLENATIEAPFDGVITNRSVEIGAILSPGTPAFRLIDISTVKVLAGIPEKNIRDFELGSMVDIVFDASPDRTYTGKISYLSPEADPAVRTFPAEITIDNRDRTLKAGIMGNASILRDSIENAVVVPLNAVIEGDDGRIVYVIQGNVAERRTVRIGSSKGEYVHIVSGLEAGDRLVVVGQYEVVDGENVNVTGEMTIDREEVAAQ